MCELIQELDNQLNIGAHWLDRFLTHGSDTMQGLLKARVNSASLTPAGGQVPSRTQQTTRNKTQLSTQRLEETQSDGTSLVGQWLRLHTPNAAGLRLLPGQGTRWLTSGSDSRICLQCRRRGFNPWVGKIPRRRAWQPTPVFLPGEPHGQRLPEGYSPHGCKESDTTEETEHARTQGTGFHVPQLRVCRLRQKVPQATATTKDPACRSYDQRSRMPQQKVPQATATTKDPASAATTKGPAGHSYDPAQPHN